MRPQFLGLGGCQVAGNVSVKLLRDVQRRSALLLRYFVWLHTRVQYIWHNDSSFWLFKHTCVSGYRSTGDDPVMDNMGRGFKNLVSE